MPVHITTSEEETITLAAAIAARARPGDVFLLSGPLGAGKSVFARGFVRALCGKNIEVPSPTFTLVQTYEAEIATLWHFDLYRLSHPDDVFELGWEEALPGGILLVEWPEKLGPHVPRRARYVRLQHDGATRRIEIDD